MAKKKKIRKAYRKRINKSMRRAQYALFLLLIGVGFVLSMMIPLRPSSSDVEKRELSRFPSFSVHTLMSGTYFDEIGLWFSDTFPFRDALVGVNSKIHNLYGFGDRLYGLSDHRQEEIPDQQETQTEPSIDVFKQEEINESLGGKISASGGVVQNLGVIVIVDDAAYELYSFSKDIADKYAAVINYTAKELEGTADVYDLLVPTSVDITMPDDERAKVNSSNQADAIRYILSCMAPQVHSVNVYNSIRSHRTEYVYYRTDHHWTALGAYYAYEQLCHAMQVQPTPLQSYTLHTFDGFLGSFYSQTKKNSKLTTHPDTVQAYEPNGDIQMTYYKKDGTPVEWKVIYDVSTWSSAGKYNTFIGGDNPYTLITNETAKRDRSCLVIKESFGNAFVPFLVADYTDVHVIDYRYWNGKIPQFVHDKQIDDVIFINNISSTRSATLVKDLYMITY